MQAEKKREEAFAQWEKDQGIQDGLVPLQDEEEKEHTE